MYEYQAALTNVVDGDTVDVTVDLGFRIHREIRLRLQGIDTHEIHGVSRDSEEYQQGIEEKRFVEEWFQDVGTENLTWPIVIRTEKRGKFGRYLAEIERKTDEAILNEGLLAEFGEEIGYSG